MSEQPPHLQRLNPEQHDAVTTVHGPLLILAGAGSGKTRVLTRRIAHLIHEGIDPRHLLAVTFTNKAAAEMKERVAELIGDKGSKVWVSTFHSTCCRILREDIEPLGYTRRFAIYDDDDQLRIVKDIVDAAGYDRERVDPRVVLRRIDHAKNHMRSVDDVVAQLRASPGDPFVRIWREYDEALRAANALDFNDLIGATVRLFREHPDVLQRWRDRFRFVMVDEYQDTNKGQYELLRLLASEHRNLAVVGDDDQSIYGFRGADVANILSFERDYPEAKVVRLEQNYRSTGNILALANAVVAKNTGRLEKRLWTQAPDGPKVQLVCAGTAADEARWVAEQIVRMRRMGHDWSDFAIIYRTNATSRLFERELTRLRVPHRIVGGRRFYERREVRDILSYLRLVVNPLDDAAFLRVINVPSRGIGPKTLNALREESQVRGQPLLRTARARGDGRTQAGKSLRAFVELVDRLSEAARDLHPWELVVRIVEDSGYRAMLEADVDSEGKLTRDAASRLENLDELVADARSFEPPTEGMAPIDRLHAWLDRVALSADTDEIPEGGEVTLLTVHSSKGLEFPVVFVVQMVEERFPHARSEETGIDEERRLAYVAFTRAMKRLVISRTSTLTSGFGAHASSTPAAPSRFLYGIPTEVVTGDVPSGDPAEGPKRTLEPPEKTKLQVLVRQLARRSGGASPRTRGYGGEAFADPEAPYEDEAPDEPEPSDEPAHRPPTPEGEYCLVELTDPAQLRRGVRVHHARLGVGEVRHVRDARVQIAFLDGQQRWLALQGAELQLLVE